MSNTITLQIGGSLDLVLRQPAPEITCIVTAACGGIRFTAKGTHMAYTLPNDKQIVVKVAYVDGHGNPAAVDGPVSWSSSADTICTAVADAADSAQCTITPVGAVGTAQIVASADADLGAGVRSLLTTLDVEVVAGEAIAGVINIVGDPTPIP